MSAVKKHNEFYGLVVKSVMATIDSQCGFELEPQSTITLSEFKKHELDIGSVIDIDSEIFVGKMALIFPAVPYLKVMEGFLGEPVESPEEVEDGVGEILNMIYGQAKQIMNDKGFNLNMAIPKVLNKEDLAEFESKVNSAVSVPFESTAGLFFLQFVFDVKG